VVQCDQCRSAEFKALPIFLVVHGADGFFWSIARQHVSSRLSGLKLGSESVLFFGAIAETVPSTTKQIGSTGLFFLIVDHLALELLFSVSTLYINFYKNSVVRDVWRGPGGPFLSDLRRFLALFSLRCCSCTCITAFQGVFLFSFYACSFRP
jgi:hypothetical protein